MATHSCVLAWRIPGTAEPGGLPSMGSHRVGHDWSDAAAVAAADEENLLPFPKYVYPSEEVSIKSLYTHRKKHQMPTLVECCDELYLAIKWLKISNLCPEWDYNYEVCRYKWNIISQQGKKIAITEASAFVENVNMPGINM